MSPPKKLHEIYAGQMSKRHDYGYPLYEPASRTIIKPGVCGYIDQHGQWNPVADLNKPEELQKKGLTTPRESLEVAPDDRDISWGPKCSEAVKGRRLGAEVGASPAALGIPVEAAVVYRYSSENEFGAILMTESPVWRESLYFDRPFREWVAENSATLLNMRPELREHGLLVVRWIYSTARCSLNAWTAKEKQVTIGFKAKVVGAGELGPDADWYESSADSGWIHSQAQEGDRKVVFLGGLHFRYTRFSRSGQHLRDNSKAPKWTFRGAKGHDSGIILDLNGDESYEITCTEVGKLETPAGDISDNYF